MDFDQPYVPSIEDAFDEQNSLRGRWRRLASIQSNASALELEPVTAWAITLPAHAVRASNAIELWLLVDGRFPFSQPRVVVPGLREDGSWPHVEDEGRLCLGKSSVRANAGARALQHVADAVSLLNYDEVQRTSAFRAEVSTYWTRGHPIGQKAAHWSLLAPTAPSREIWRYFDSRRNRIIWADGKPQLIAWLQNYGVNAGVRDLHAGWMVWLPTAPIPTEFPRVGIDVLSHLPADTKSRLIRPGQTVYVLFGTSTDAGPVFVGAEIDPPPAIEVAKGFRRGRFSSLPVFNWLATRSVRRLAVQRIDGSYVHGRDRNADYHEFAKMRVAILGCGALGSAIAKLLAQAGIGSFIFVDDDHLAAHNTSRHVLGNRWVSIPKADATAGQFHLDFPHHGPHEYFPVRIGALSASQWEKLMKSDLLISAGLDFAGDMELNARRLASQMPPPHVCTWIEPFGLAGHAIAIFDSDDLSTAFGEDGNPKFELTRWPKEIQLEFPEAGCGNTFQPHGAVDLQRTALTATNLCIEVLLGQVATSTSRTWQGDLSTLARLGGIANSAFNSSNVEQSRPFPPVANGKSSSE